MPSRRNPGEKCSLESLLESILKNYCTFLEQHFEGSDSGQRCVWLGFDDSDENRLWCGVEIRRFSNDAEVGRRRKQGRPLLAIPKYAGAIDKSRPLNVDDQVVSSHLGLRW